MLFFVKISKYIVGSLFLFSGLIKINDPVGTSIKLKEYFQVFSADFSPLFEFFIPFTLFLSVFLSVLEVVIGVALLFSYQFKITIWVLLSLLIFFTFLTFYSAYFDKVTDCGCFGDAIKLTPWQSFFKDLGLIVLSIPLLSYRRQLKPIFNRKVSNLVVASSLAVALFCALFAILYLPFVDFRHYAVGNNLREMMQPKEKVKYEYVFEKKGKEYKFLDFPEDTTYAFKRMEILNPITSQPILTDFSVWQDDIDITQEILTGTKLLWVFHDLKKSYTKSISSNKYLLNTPNIPTVVITSSDYALSEVFRHQYQLNVPFYTADETVVKTIVRSNPGWVLINKGVVLGKWSHRNTPTLPALQELVK